MPLRPQTDPAPRLERTWTAAELRKLARDQRDAILEAAAALAENQYQSGGELTDFDAFGLDDLVGESTAASKG